VFALQIIDPVIDRREIRCGVVVPAVAFSNDDWPIGQFGNVAKENHDRAFADLGQAAFHEPLHHARQPIVVKAFAALDVVVDVQAIDRRLQIPSSKGPRSRSRSEDFPPRRPVA
jgi:hypothetical protein